MDTNSDVAVINTTPVDAGAVSTTPVTPITPTPTTIEAPKAFGSYMEKAQADIAAAFANKTGQQTDNGQAAVATPATPATPTATTTGADDFDNFTLDLDADHTKATVQPTEGTVEQPQQTGATQAQTTDQSTTPTPTDGKLATEEIPVEFSDVEKAAIQKYLQTPTSQRFREQAKIVREISKPIEKGGLGRTPSPQEIINAAQLAESFRTLMDDYTSGDQNAVNNWAQNWMFQMARTQDGRIAPAIDPTTNLPVMRPGSVQATASIIQNAVLHPETANLAAETIYKSISEAHNNGAPWATEALTRIGAPVLHGLLGQLESIIPTAQNQYVTLTDVDGKEVRIPGNAFIKSSQQLIKEAAGLADPNTANATDDPEKAALRARLAQYEKGQRTNQQQQLQATITRANQGFKEFFLHNLSQDVKLRLDPLAKVVAATNDDAAKADFDLTVKALSGTMLELVRNSPVFANQHKQFLRDIRAGIPVEDARKPLMRTARELYNNTLLEEGKKILRSRIGGSNRPVQSTSNSAPVTQPQPTTVQPANGTTTPVSAIPQGQQGQNNGNPNPAGRPVTAIPQAGNGINTSGLSDAKHILPGESHVEYFKRQMMLSLGNRQQ